MIARAVIEQLQEEKKDELAAMREDVYSEVKVSHINHGVSPFIRPPGLIMCRASFAGVLHSRGASIDFRLYCNRECLGRGVGRCRHGCYRNGLTLE